MSSGLCLLTLAGRGALDRALILCGAVAQQGGAVVLLTHSLGAALSQISFGLEIVVRRAEPLAQELLRLESVALSRGAGVVLLDDEEIDDRCAAAVRVLSSQVPVARYGRRLLSGAAGELPIDPFAAASQGDPGPLGGGCFGLRYLPLHPGLRALRERAAVSGEVRRVTIACGESEDGALRGVRALEALSSWRPVLRVALLCDPALPPEARAAVGAAIARSRHEVRLQPPAAGHGLAEALLCDLALVDGAQRAAVAAHLGTPVVALSANPEEGRRCEALARAGVAVHVPDFGEGALPPALLGDLLWSLCADERRRRHLSRTAQLHIDGQGAQRIAAALLDLSQSRGR